MPLRRPRFARHGARGCVSAVLAGVMASSCASAPTPTAPSPTKPDGGDGGVTAPMILTMGAHVPGDGDLYRCRYFVMPPRPSFFVGASHTNSIGTHHVLLFRTDLAAIPSGGETERDCFLPADDVMPHARAQVYGSQQRSGTFAFPADVGLPLAAGEVLLAQTHYLNASGSDLDAQVALTLTLADGPMAQRAGTLYFADPFIDVAAHQRARASMRCAIPDSATLLTAVITSHTRSVDFAAFVDPPAGPPAGAPFYHAPGWLNPLPLQSSVPLAAGSHVRFACAYDNSAGANDYVSGPRNNADEACIFSGIYFPALASDVDLCRVAPDNFGTGTATCAQTLACVGACAASGAPPTDFGLGAAASIDPCWQRCIADSCADASSLLFARRACVAAKCNAACANDAGTACADCTQSRCPTEASACDADACP